MTKIISPIPAIAKKAAVPADMLSREEIERFLAFRGDYLELRREHVRELAQRALSEPTRLAAARAEGYREGAEAARQVALHWLASLETARDRATSALAHAEAAQLNQRVCGIAIVITAISALSPAPAEPGDGWIDWRGNEVEGTDDGPPIPKGQEYSIRSRAGHELTLAWPDDELLSWNHEGGDEDVVAYRIGKTAEPSAPVAPEDDALVDRFAAALKEKMAIARAKGRSGWQASDWERVCRADLAAHLAKGDVRDCALYLAFMWHHGWKPVTDEFASLVEQVKAQAAALEAENAALKARNAELTEGLRPFAEIAEWYGEPMADDRGIEIERPYGHFRRARTLLQGGPDAG